MKSKLVLLFILCSIQIFAQTNFVKIFSDASTNDSISGVHLVQTFDNNYSFLCKNSPHNVVIRINNDGTEFRRFEFGNYGALSPVCIAANSQLENYIIGNDGLSNTAYLLRTDSNGVVSYFLTNLYGAVGDSRGLAVYITPDDFFAYQLWEDDEMCSNPTLIVKVDNSNFPIWQGTISFDVWNYSKEAIRFTNGNEYYSVSPVYVNCYDTNAYSASDFNQNQSSFNQPIQRYLDLYTNIDTINGNGFILSNNLIFSRTDLVGNILWTKPIPFTSDIISLKVTADSSILIAGNTNVNGFKNQVALSKLNSQGGLLWTKYYGEKNDESFSNFFIANDGGYTLSGTTHSFGNKKAFILKTDTSGFVGISFPLIFTNQNQICPNDSAVITLASGYSYSWNTGDSTQTISTSIPGNYFATLTDSSGNRFYSDTISISQFTIQQISLPPDTTFCGHAALSLIAPTGYLSYSWNNGALSNINPISFSGTYSVVAVDSNFCPTVDSINVIIATLPTFSLGADTSICTNNLVQLSSPMINQWTWNNGSSDSLLAVNQSGLYSISFTNGICTESDSIQLSIYQPAFVNIVDDTTLCTINSIVLDAGSGFSSYQWQDGSTLQTYLADTLNPSSVYYSVSVVDSNGCSASDDVVIDWIICSEINDQVLFNKFILVPTLISAGESVTILSSKTKSCNIEIVDILGKIQFTQSIDVFPTNLTLPLLNRGLYLVRFSNSNNVIIEVEKLVIQ